MKISIMREFVTLAANRNFSKTAEDLYMAQSVLSRHMSAVEEELDVKLIERDRNIFALTPAGSIVLEEFKLILNEYQRMLDRIEGQNIEEGELHLGYLYYDANYYVSKIRREFRNKYPKIKLVLHGCQPTELEELLFSGKIDSAILYGMTGTNNNDLNYLPFLKVPYSLIFDKSHRFAKMRTIKIEDLEGEKVIHPEVLSKVNKVEADIQQMLQKDGKRLCQDIKVTNHDEVPWLMKETGAIFVSPMINRTVYGDETYSCYIGEHLFSADISNVWLKKNQNPTLHLLNTVLKKCYS